ncbi:two-partner secretion domain-containing protein, partial [Thiomicrospira microaerophila]|uniref:two-partner secretion domain-containing protein n=1 Tax=Thiomicrospira microaerophila TaxID=406020 RepID=UPI0006983E16
MHNKNAKIKRASLNHTYRLVWSDAKQMYIAVAEIAPGKGKRKGGIVGAIAALMMGFGGIAHALDPGTLPEGANITHGQAQIQQHNNVMTIHQTSDKLITHWNSFNIGKDATVNFQQPNSNSAALNRVMDNNPSQIHGRLNANGNVYLVNPSGILFGKTAQVDVGGLIASTLEISDQDFLDNQLDFKNLGFSEGDIKNLGHIRANGGVVALIANRVSNQGTIEASNGNVALAAGDHVTLDFNGDGLMTVTVEQGVLDALAENGGLIQADGGFVIMTTQARQDIYRNLVNNDGLIQAQTLANKSGRIMLMGGMSQGQVIVDGTLDASAPNGGDGGFIETSAANVTIQESVHVTTQSSTGKTGTWLIDPTDINIVAGADESNLDGTNPATGSGNNITNTTIQNALDTTNVLIQTIEDGSEAGNINVNAAIGWFTNNTLTLDAHNDININANIQSFNGNLILDAGGSVALASNYQVRMIDGDLTIDAGGNITQGANSYFQVGGTASLSAIGNIALDQTTNKFSGNVNIAAASVNFVNDAATTLANVAVTGDASFSSTGIITGLAENTINIGGNSNFSTTANNADILLLGEATLGSTATFSAHGNGNIRIADGQGDLTFGAVTTGGRFEVEADGDIVVDGAINGTGAGDSGLISLESTAGSINVNDKIRTEGGNVKLVATENVTSTAEIETTAAINTGRTSGSVTIQGDQGVNLGALVTTQGANNNQDVGSNAASVSVSSSSGNVVVSAITTSGGDATNSDNNFNGGGAGNITINASGIATLNGSLTGEGGQASGTSEQGLGAFITVVAGDKFINNAGANSLKGNVWRIWSRTPADDTTGALIADFIQYGATYNSTTVQGTGNGLLYQVVPTIDTGTINLGGSTEKVYDGNRDVTNTDDITAQMDIFADLATAILAGSTLTSFEFDNKNAGENKTVTGSLTFAESTELTTNGGQTQIYGVDLTALTSPIAVSGNIGTITPKALTGSITAGESIYGDAYNVGILTLTGVIEHDDISSSVVLATDGLLSSAGWLRAGTHTGIQIVTLSGDDLNNYSVDDIVGDYTVTQRALTGASITSGTSVYGSSLNPGAVSFGNWLSGDDVGSTVTVNTSTKSTAGYDIVGNYTQTASGLSGDDAGNYTFAGFTSDTANYSITQYQLTGASIAAASSIYGDAITAGSA